MFALNFERNKCNSVNLRKPITQENKLVENKFLTFVDIQPFSLRDSCSHVKQQEIVDFDYNSDKELKSKQKCLKSMLNTAASTFYFDKTQQQFIIQKSKKKQEDNTITLEKLRNQFEFQINRPNFTITSNFFSQNKSPASVYNQMVKGGKKLSLHSQTKNSFFKKEILETKESLANENFQNYLKTLKQDNKNLQKLEAKLNVEQQENSKISETKQQVETKKQPSLLKRKDSIIYPTKNITPEFTNYVLSFEFKQQRSPEINNLITNLQNLIKNISLNILQLKKLVTNLYRVGRIISTTTGFNQQIGQMLLKFPRYKELRENFNEEMLRFEIVDQIIKQNAQLEENNSYQLFIHCIQSEVTRRWMQKLNYFNKNLFNVMENKQSILDKLKSDVIVEEIQYVQEKQCEMSHLPKYMKKKQILNQLEDNISHILERNKFMKQENLIEKLEKQENNLGEFKSISNLDRMMSRNLDYVNENVREQKSEKIN